MARAGCAGVARSVSEDIIAQATGNVYLVPPPRAAEPGGQSAPIAVIDPKPTASASVNDPAHAPTVTTIFCEVDRLATADCGTAPDDSAGKNLVERHRHTEVDGELRDEERGDERGDRAPRAQRRIVRASDISSVARRSTTRQNTEATPQQDDCWRERPNVIRSGSNGPTASPTDSHRLKRRPRTER